MMPPHMTRVHARKTPLAFLSLCTAALLGAVGCIPKLDPTSAEAAQSAEGKACGASGMIDDCEDNNAQVIVQGGRTGYWYTFTDGAGSTVTPIPGDQGGTFEMTPGGANGTLYAAHVKGVVGNAEDPFVGVGFNFVDPKGPYDASQYQGITFYAKSGPAQANKVRFKTPDIDTDPDGHVCSECYNDFARDIELTPNWTRYTIPFSRVKQLETWGDPIVDEVDKSKLFSVQFHVKEPGATFDLWIDQVQFTGCH